MISLVVVVLGKCRKLHLAELRWIEIYKTHIYMCIDLFLPPFTSCVMSQILPYLMSQLTFQFWRTLLPAFTITHKHRPLPAHFSKQTSSLFQHKVPYVRCICPFLNRLTCVGFCYCFYSRFLSWHIIAEVFECCAPTQIFLP